jgi:hypothetical protein
MALIKGMLVWYADPILHVPTLIPFQYNPDAITRTLRFESAPRAGLDAPRKPVEDYAMTLELDATDGLERGGPLTTLLGVGPRLAALEMLMQPVGTGELAQLLGTGTSTPRGELPFVLFVWGPNRVAPVRLSSLTIKETGFDELLNPIHATAEVGFAVLRSEEIGDTVSRMAIEYYEGSREAKALIQMAQSVEMLAP